MGDLNSKHSRNEDTPIENLPAEMIVKILNANPCKGGKLTARQVCRRWRWIVDEPWWGLLSFTASIESDEPAAVAFINSRIQFDSLYIYGIGKTDWPEISLLEPLPRIQKIFIGWGNSGETLITFLSCGMETLECLSFPPSSLAYVTANAFGALISQSNWCNLAELQMSVMLPPVGSVNEEGTQLVTVQTAQDFKFQRESESHSDAVACFLRLAALPKLKIFQFFLMSNYGVELDSRMIPIISEFTGFLERHASTLKDLSLSISWVLTGEPKFCLIGPIFSAERQESIGKTLELESFKISISHFECLVNLVPPCLWGSSKLKKLVVSTRTSGAIDKGGMPSLLLNNPIQDMIKRSQETLVSVDITFGYINDDIFHPHWLETLSGLRDLTLTNINCVIYTAVQLPQVTRLTVACRSFSEGLPRIGDWSGWIARSFVNVENIKIYGLTQLDNKEHCEWLANLLPLIKLKLSEITYFTHWSCFAQRAFEARVRGYCLYNARLDYVRDGLIRVLPEWDELEEYEEYEE